MFQRRRQSPLHLLFTLLCVSLSSCETSPPIVPLLPLVERGRVFVRSNVDGAAIVLDGLATGMFTPETLETPVGRHVVRLEKGGFLPSTQSIVVSKDSVAVVFISLQATVQRLVLLEDFSNVSCVPCVSSNLILESLHLGTYGHSKIAVIKYPTNFPSATDPFYLAARADCDARMAWYNILFAPTVIVDGVGRPTPTDSSAMKDSVNVRLLMPVEFSIAVTQAVASGLLSATVVVTPLDTAIAEFADLVLHTVVTETEITFATPPGSNGETHFHDVMRAMLPSSSGERLAEMNRIGAATYYRQVQLGAGWSIPNLHTTAFIQHRLTKRVLQAGSTW